MFSSQLVEFLTLSKNIFFLNDLDLLGDLESLLHLLHFSLFLMSKSSARIQILMSHRLTFFDSTTGTLKSDKLFKGVNILDFSQKSGSFT